MLKDPSYIAPDSHSEKKKTISSDKLLWNSFKEGSRKSFKFIYDQNYENLLSYGMKICSDQALVEDQIQELFIYLWQKKENLDIKVSIAVYLLWALRNRIINCLKKTQFMPIDDAINDLSEDNEATEEKYNSLHEAINALPQKQKEAITLKYFQQLDGDEIAKILNITIGSTYNLLSRALDTLKKNLPDSLLIALLTLMY